LIAEALILTQRRKIAEKSKREKRPFLIWLGQIKKLSSLRLRVFALNSSLFFYPDSLDLLSASGYLPYK